MVIKSRGVRPVTDPSVYVAPNAVLTGDVKIGPDSRVMFGAVLSSEGAQVQIGSCCIICEQAVLRGSSVGEETQSVIGGDHVFIGPHAKLIGCTVDSYTFDASGAVILQGATVREGAVIAVAALVHAGTVVPEGFCVPPNSIVLGDPITVMSPSDKDVLVEAVRSIGFVQKAFGVSQEIQDRRAVMKEITQTRSREFSAHLNDEIVTGDSE